MFGIGTGDIELNISGTTFSPGEVIEGRLILTMKKAAMAKGVFIKLVAEQPFRQAGGRAGYQGVTYTSWVSQQLDGDKEYVASPEPIEYPFKIKIPVRAEVTASFKKHFPRRVSLGPWKTPEPTPTGPMIWSLEGYLEIPHALDVKKRIPLNIS